MGFRVWSRECEHRPAIRRLKVDAVPAAPCGHGDEHGGVRLALFLERLGGRVEGPAPEMRRLGDGARE